MKTKIILAGCLAFLCMTDLDAQSASDDQDNLGFAPVMDCSAYGFGALGNITLSSYGMTATGYKSMFLSVYGDRSVANGAYSLYNDGKIIIGGPGFDGHNNIAMGNHALYNNYEGDDLTATGYYALYSNQKGLYNTASGSGALYSNTNSGYNTAIGYQALYTNDAGAAGGDENTAAGSKALFSNQSGDQNTAIGTEALYSNDLGSGNTAMGYQALYNNSTDPTTFDTGIENTGVGKAALFNNVSGHGNVGIGAHSLYYNTTGRRNLGIGLYAGYHNTSGYENVAIGINALYSNTTGDANVAVGDLSLQNATASYNTAIGTSALALATTGVYNTAFGLEAGNFTSGSPGAYNTYFGAHTGLTSSSYTNASAIGAGALASGDDIMQLGDVNVTDVYTYTLITAVSDGRFKTNISQDDVKGLDFIRRLRPVVYNFEAAKYADFLCKNMPDSLRKKITAADYTHKTAIRQSGFIAQEVEQAAKASGYDFNGIKAPADENGHYALSYEKFVVPLTKAVQEQQVMIDTQKALAEQVLQGATERRQQLNGLLSLSSVNADNSSENGFSMDATPNPFNGKCIVKYTLPGTVNKAYLAVYDLNGTQVVTYDLPGNGANSVTISSEKLPAGIYI